MKIVNSGFQTLSTYYDFANEGGTFGSSIDLGLIIPKNSIVVRTVLRTWIAPASAGLATISFDRTVGAVLTTGFYSVAQAFSNFVTTPGSEVLPGFDFNATPLVTDATSDSAVGMTIGVADLTAGRIQIIIQILQTDILG